jgi:glycosyltransferase involved in cell wall biosynthesis
VNTIRAVLSILRSQGFGGVLRRIGERLTGTSSRLPSPLRYEDALAVDWRIPHPAVVSPITVSGGSLTVAWIMSPPGIGSGGHQNIFRFVRFLEAAGHRVQIYLYSADKVVSLSRARQVAASSSYPQIDASIELYPANGVAKDVDAIIATGWETAYPSFLDPSLARRIYFVQDYEPYFYPVGTDSVLAENSYRFGFAGITAGGWLAHKLAKDFGMATSFFDFSADRKHYHLTNGGPRKEILFYVRPGTERRGFELGIMALDLFAKARPDYTINLAGWDVSRYRIPFAHHNLKTMPVDRLNEVYNRCAAALVLSMTNMSLLPLELIASGVIPVVNDGDNNTMVSSNAFIEYSPALPRALADRLIAIVDRPDLSDHARAAALSLDDAGWSKSGAQFVAAFERVMRG